jgi:hypothetical protein
MHIDYFEMAIILARANAMELRGEIEQALALDRLARRATEDEFRMEGGKPGTHDGDDEPRVPRETDESWYGAARRGE